MKKHTKRKIKFKFKKLKRDLHWLDAVSESGWISEEDMEEQEPAKAVCNQMWIYKETKKHITLLKRKMLLLFYEKARRR